MKIKSHTIGALLSVAAMACSTTATARTTSYQEHHDDYEKLKLYHPILEADAVVTGTAKYVISKELIEIMEKRNGQEENTPLLLKIEKPQFLSGGEEVEKNAPVLIWESPSRYMGDPILWTRSASLVFLKKKTADAEFRRIYSLRESDQVYELCSEWQSSIGLDFQRQLIYPDGKKFDPLEVKVLRDRYHITESLDLLPRIIEMSAWRRLKTKGEKIASLFKLLQDNRYNLLYTDNIPPMLATLGASAVLKDDKYTLDVIEPPNDNGADNGQP